MKILKTKIIWFSTFLFIGIVLFAVNLISLETNPYVTGFSAGMIAVSLIKIFQFIKISKNQKSLKKFEIEQNEERIMMLAEKSGRYTLLITIIIELAAAIIFMLLKKNNLAMTLATVAGLQTFLNLIMYYWMSKKF